MERYEAGDDCAQVSFLPWYAFPCSSQKTTGESGYCSAEIQDRHFRQRMLWYGHEGCKYFQLPKSNVEFWKEKIERNIARDVRNETELKALGWRVIRVWECEIKTVKGREEYLKQLYNCIVRPTHSYFIESETDELSMAAEPESEHIYGKDKDF